MSVDGKIIVRVAAVKDVDCLVNLGEEFHGESIYRNQDFDRKKVEKTLSKNIVENNNTQVLVADLNGLVIGFIAAQIGTLFFSSEITATALAFYVSKPHRGSSAALRLLKAYRVWAVMNRAKRTFVFDISGIDKKSFAAIMKKVGFNHLGGNYVANVD